MTANVELVDVTKQFGNGLVAVDKARLSVAAGEVVCLLGPSGCGKTTTLRMIAGLEHATSGDILIGGQRVNPLPARARNVAMTFQFYALYPSLTVEENLAYPLYAERLSKTDIAARVKRVSAVLDLDGVLRRLPYQLGEGEKQRVAVGRSIIREPTCFLFDEPLSRLDIQLRQSMRTQIIEVLSKLDKPAVIVTHDQIEALTMADRIAVMNFGKIEQVASPHSLFAQPANVFVAGFIGTPQMNLIKAVLGGVDAPAADGTVRAKFRLLGEEITAPVKAKVAELARDCAVTIGIRPRSFEFVGPEMANALHAKVDILEPMGAELLAHLVEGDTDMRCVVPHTTKLRVGQRIGLRCKPGQLHVFDANGILVE
ncbi:MAG: ABC transporter ATP-binding protein [Methylobacteriaceae bacterium]|nr:ABC transporter ATP-binding protein [Methylobacteriaceae bacterium]